MASARRKKRAGGSRAPAVRIVAGRWRSRRLRVPQRVRPMKDRTREALFNILGPQVQGRFVLDVFAGTGALALEALSRGAEAALWIERDPLVLQVLRENVQSVGADRIPGCRIVAGDAFQLLPRLSLPQDKPWLVFLCPPYHFFEDRSKQMQQLIRHLWNRAPGGSLLVVEAPQGFSPTGLPQPQAWQHRRYAPAELYWAIVPGGRETSAPGP